MKKCFTSNGFRELTSQGFCTALQPIMTGDIAESPVVYGYELLSRQCKPGERMKFPGHYLSSMSLEHLATLDALSFQDATNHVVGSLEETTAFHFNCSVLTLVRPDFVEFLARKVKMLAEVERKRLVLEITETEALDERGDLRQWDRLRKHCEIIRGFGVGISIDDFGCGHAPLRLIRSLTIDSIKFSKDVLDDCYEADNLNPTHNDSLSLELMRSIGKTVRNWGCDVVVEGIECEEHLPVALSLGANRFQGYHFGAPLVQQSLPDSDDIKFVVGQ